MTFKMDSDRDAPVTAQGGMYKLPAYGQARIDVPIYGQWLPAGRGAADAEFLHPMLEC